MESLDIQKLEIDLLLETLLLRHGFDFKNFSRQSLERRIVEYCEISGIKHISEIIPLIIHDPSTAPNFVNSISVTVTELFRDPQFFKSVIDLVIPSLKSYPFLKIWVAGCATGEEVYSLAIILKKFFAEGKYQIYATDMNSTSLETARLGVYPQNRLDTYIKNFRSVGLDYDFWDFFEKGDGDFRIKDSYKEGVSFFNHHLGADANFGEMNVIFCRNVLIYFNEDLRERTISQFVESLARRGYLCIGIFENLDQANGACHLKEVEPATRIYRKFG